MSELPESMQAQAMEMGAIADLLNRAMVVCLNKCVSLKYNDEQLTRSEAVCIDRCAAKYMLVQDAVSKHMTDAQNRAAPPQQ
eukprot:m.74456 g.74456  ORF g.74456 m.74456 type:complete len:82 (-) comp8053_c0_seq2:2230-2475(-)